jgi:thienamycin biosynthesis protein ThnO
MFNIPVVMNNKYIHTLECQEIHSLDNEVLGRMSLFPLIRMHEIRNSINDQYKKMCTMPIGKVLDALKKAAEVFKRMDFNIDGVKIDRDTYTGMVSMSTGLPKAVVDNEINEIAAIMADMEEIISVQVPGGSADIFDSNFYYVKGHKVGYYPTGKSLAIKLPGNIPTICIYWLIPFAQKRPIILIPPKEDPFTHFLIFEAIKLACPELAALITFLPCSDGILPNLFNLADQVMISESMKEMFYSSPELLSKVHFIHYGRSKFVIDHKTPEMFADAVCRRMTWNCGRTCTGLTSAIVRGNAREFAYRVAERLKDIAGDSFDGECAVVPMFEMERAKKMNEMIEQYVEKGEVIDVTEEIRGCGRFSEHGKVGVLLPTVLFIAKKDSEMFGVELPFPFITIIEAADEDELLQYARQSLILSVVSEDRGLADKFCSESSILKVFSGEHIERGYNYYDPHEGYIADFTYQKKAVFP